MGSLIGCSPHGSLPPEGLFRYPTGAFRYPTGAVGSRREPSRRVRRDVDTYRKSLVRVFLSTLSTNRSEGGGQPVRTLELNGLYLFGAQTPLFGRFQVL